MPRHLVASAAISLLLAACSPASPVREPVEIFVSAEAYFVDGQPFASPAEAVRVALDKTPIAISVPACSAMPTQRVIGVTSELQGKYSGRLSMSVVSGGARGCPAFN